MFHRKCSSHLGIAGFDTRTFILLEFLFALLATEGVDGVLRFCHCYFMVMNISSEVLNGVIGKANLLGLGSDDHLYCGAMVDCYLWSSCWLLCYLLCCAGLRLRP